MVHIINPPRLYRLEKSGRFADILRARLWNSIGLNMLSTIHPTSMKTQLPKLIFLSILFLSLFLVLASFDPGGDWSAVLQPSTRSFLSGHNPYDEPRFLSPPWAFLVLIPTVLLPPQQGSALFAIIGATGYLLAIYRLKAKPLALIFLIATPGFLAALFNPNFDWAVALGYTLPPQIGLFFVLSKPQISAPLVVFWLIESWRSGGFRKVVWVFSPVAFAYGISFLLFGPWILHIGTAISSLSNTANVWPWGLLAGSVLAVVAFHQRKANFALIAGPFFSPYLAPYSWLPAAIGLLPGTLETIAVCLAFWVAWLITIL
jgi:hypothetical protein